MSSTAARRVVALIVTTGFVVATIGVFAVGGAVITPEGHAAAAATSTVDGYWMVDQRGHVHTFGNAPHLGEGLYGTVDLASTRTGSGYWLVTATGDVVSRGDARDLGGPVTLSPGESVVAIAGDPAGTGAWIFTNRGRVVNRGGASHFGDASGAALNQPVIDATPTPDGRGYWLIASDGGVFTYGTAAFYGSMGDQRLNGPVVGLAPTPSGAGYWLVATDGGIFSFGDAAFYGSMGDRRLNRPVNGMVTAGSGYLMSASDGGVFTFGPGAPFHGSLGATPIPWAVVAIEPVPIGATPSGLGPNPARVSRAAPVDPARVAASWRPGCPVPLSDLYLVTVDYWDMTGRLRTGELVLHVDKVAPITYVMFELHSAHFPIAQMELVDLYAANDNASMAANNTSAFNCRAVTGGASFSTHSWGRAIDINPVQNPYVTSTIVLPPNGAPWATNRDASVPGLIVASDPIVALFAGLSGGGWIWGGNWSSPRDYQHFESNDARR